MASLKDTNILGKLVVTDKIIKSGGTSNDILLANGDTITKSSLSGEITNNTTYTFVNGTNCFYVTPSGGSQQTVTVTPSIANNITGSGTSGYLTKFDGTNTITSGPALGSDTTKYLRNDGTWAVPPGTTPDLSGYLPLSGGTMTGRINVASNMCGLLFRSNSDTWYSGIRHGSSGDEALVFENVNPRTSWIFRIAKPTDYTTTWSEVVPCLHIKNQRVAINKLIADGEQASYNLDVEGTIGASGSIYENGTSLANKYVTLDGRQVITGRKVFTANSAGDSSISTSTDAITLAATNRKGDVGTYLPGISWNCLEVWSSNAYVGGSQAWIGTRLVSTAGSEIVDLVFATKETTEGGVQRPTERMCITSAGNIGIGTKAPEALLHVNGKIKASNLEITSILAPTSSDSTTYGVGTSGQVLKSNGTTVYWGTDNSGGSTFTLPTRLAASSSTSVTANGALEQGWHYINDGTTNRPPFKQVDSVTGNDYRIMTTSYGNTWLQQIATDFRSNDIFIRRNQSGTWQPWTAVVRTLPCSVNGTTHSMPSITHNAIVRWATDRTATIQNSGVRIDDSNNIDGVNSLTIETSPASGIASLTAHADGSLMVNGEKLATQAWVQNYVVEDKIISATIVSQAQLFDQASTPTGTWVDGYWNTGSAVGGWAPESATTSTSTLATVTTTNQTVNLRAPYSNKTIRERWVLRIQSQGVSSISLSGAQYSQISQNEYKIYFDNKSDGRVINITKGTASFKITVNFNNNNWID